MTCQILVVGEALIDIVISPDGSSEEHCGGSPANVALGLARLGRETALLARLGSDDRGARIADHLGSNGVQVLPETMTASRTSTAQATIDEDGVASYDFQIDWQIPTLNLSALGPQAVHTGSIAAFLAPGGDAVIELVRSARESSTISYDPNARPRLMGDPEAARARMEQIVAIADVVKVSDEDLAWLAPGEDPEAVIRQWRSTGPALVILTRGGDGATGISAHHQVSVQAPTIQVADTVGAGDTFSAGILDFLAEHDLLGAANREALANIDEATLRTLLTHAATAAAITCTRAGANPPNRQELIDWLSQA